MRTKLNSRRLLLIAAVLVLLPSSMLGQPTQTPVPVGSTTYWSPDCEGGWNAGPSGHNPQVMGYREDNQGSPQLEFGNEYWSIRLLKGATRLNNAIGKLTSFNAVSDGNGGQVIVYQAAKNLTSLTTAGAVRLRADGRENTVLPARMGATILLRSFNSSGTIVPAFTKDVSETQDAAYNPYLVKTSDGGYIVTWITSQNISDTMNPVKMWMRKYSSTGSDVWGAPVSVSASTGFADISQFAVTADLLGGAVVLATTLTYANGSTADRHVEAQRVNSSGVPQWSGVHNMLVINDDTTTSKYNPLISYNSAIDRFVFAWTSATTQPYAWISFQAVDNSGNLRYAAQGLATTISPRNTTSEGTTESYMVTFGQNTWLYGQQGILVKLDNGDVALHAYDMAATAVFQNWTTVLVDHTITTEGYPAALITDDSGNRDITAVWCDNGTFKAASFYSSYFGLKWSQNSLATGITSPEYQSEICQDGSYFYLALPDKHNAYLRKLSKSTGTWAADETVALRSTLHDDPHVRLTVAGSNVALTYFEDGLSAFQTEHFDRETREKNSNNSSIGLQYYSHSGATFSPVLTTPASVCYSKIQSSAKSASFRDLSAVVFEEFSPAGIPDIYCGLADGTTLQVTDASSTSDASRFYSPQVAVFTSALGSYAYVTYVHDYMAGAGYSKLAYKLVDLVNKTVGTEGVIDQNDGLNSMQNYAMVLDTDIANGCMLSVFGRGSYSATDPGSESIWYQRINSAGWLQFPSIIRADMTIPAGRKTGVTTAFVPDFGVGNSGAYVAWTFGADRSELELQYIASVGGTSAGTTKVTSISPMYDPQIVADSFWVMCVWTDERDYLDPPIARRRPMIYGIAYDRYWNRLAGWGATGNLLSSISMTPPSSSLYYRATEPSLAAVVTSGTNPTFSSQGALLAFSEDVDGDFKLLGDTTRRHQIGTRFIPVDGTAALGTQYNLLFANGISPVTDRINAMFGYDQWRPTLKLVRSPLTGISVLCAFQMLSDTSDDIDWAESAVQKSGFDHVRQNSTNIGVRQLDITGGMTIGTFTATSKPGAQELVGLHQVDGKGLVAYYQTYDNSDNWTGDVRSVDLNEEMIMPAASTAWDLSPTGACGTQRTTGDYVDVSVPTWNNSPCELIFGPAASGSTFSIQSPSNPAYLSAGTLQNIVVRHTPALNCVTDNGSYNSAYRQFDLSPRAFNYIISAAAKQNFHAGENGEFSLRERLAGNALAVKVKSSEPGQVILFDLLGRVQESKDFVSSAGVEQDQFDLSRLPEGSYFLRATSGGRAITHKILLSR